MSEDAWSLREPLRTSGEPPGGRPRSPWGAVLAAVVAIAAFAGLAWWFAIPVDSGERPSTPPPPPRASPEAPLRYAALEPNPDQVRRAWRDVQAAYSEGGAGGLTRVSANCARRLPADPGLLDYCLAFDIYASEIVPAGQDEWLADSRERDLALARTALPAAADPAGRIAQVGALTRAVLPHATRPQGAAAKPQAVGTIRPPQPPTVNKARGPGPRAARPKTISTSAHAAAARRTQPAVSRRCEWELTRADRLVCLHDDLAAADRRMKSAYDQAIAAGVDPEILGEQQENWREARDHAADQRELRDLYRRRIQDLESQTPPY